MAGCSAAACSLHRCCAQVRCLALCQQRVLSLWQCCYVAHSCNSPPHPPSFLPHAHTSFTQPLCSHHNPPCCIYISQAMFVDFGMAAQYGGHCYLRFDDTNPEAEKQEYIDHIQVGAARSLAAHVAADVALHGYTTLHTSAPYTHLHWRQFRPPPPKKHTHMPNMRVGAYIAVHHLHLYLPTLLNLIASLSTCAAPYVGPPVADDVGDCVLDGLVSLANYICLVIFWSLA